MKYPQAAGGFRGMTSLEANIILQVSTTKTVFYVHYFSWKNKNYWVLNVKSMPSMLCVWSGAYLEL